VILSILIPLVLQAGGAPAAVAGDTTPLYLERKKQLDGTPFFCQIGRQPVVDTIEALSILPTPACRFNGPLDSVRDPVRLEPPFLNPALRAADISAMLAASGIALGGDGRFTVAGEGFRIQTVGFKDLKETLFHLGAFNSAWGPMFPSIVADRASGVAAFAKAFPAAFWANPHVSQERAAMGWLLRTNRTHTALPLIPKCGDFGPLPHLLLVGDMHRGEDSAYFQGITEKYDFSYVALELTLDKQSAMDSFLAAKDTGSEAPPLAAITDGYPKDVIGPYHSLLRSLKSRHTPIVLVDRVQAYFNFPYTDLGFHGLPLAARNLLWAARLPATWDKPAVLFAGRDHFLDLPSADFQDFALARFPGLEMKLVNPMEICPH
jgi:hypothetical protein